MGAFVTSQVIKLMARGRGVLRGERVLVLGLTFKENCPDLRNTRVVDIVAELHEYGIDCGVCDPWVDPGQAQEEYGITLVEPAAGDDYDAIILAVSHRQFAAMGITTIRSFGKPGAVVYDVKHLFPKEQVDGRL